MTLINNQMLKVAGRDKNGLPQPFLIDDKGKLMVAIENSGADIGETGITALDIHSGVQKPLSALQDSVGNYVLRTVDSAPILTEVGYFEEANYESAFVSPIPSKILDENPYRKFLSLSNLSDNSMFLTFEQIPNQEVGIFIAPKERYEMSILKGNLNYGDIFIHTDGDLINLFDVDKVEQGGSSTANGFSDSLVRTRVYPISVQPNTRYVASVNSEDVRIRNVISYRVEGDLSSGTDLTGDQVANQIQFTTPSNAVEVVVSFCKINTTEDITPEETIDANPVIVESNDKIVVTEGF